ncbi:MAG: hypothetical protein E6J15_13885, partial [Chloroflexi bacterium]
MRRVAQCRSLACELQGQELGYTRCREGVGRGEGSPHAQRDENATHRIGRDERSDHRRIRDAVIGQADRCACLDGRATPSRLLDRRPSRNVADRFVGDVVRIARTSGAIDEERQPVVLAERREGRKPNRPFVRVARDLTSGHDRRREQTAHDRRQRRFLTNDAIAGGAEGLGRPWLPDSTPPRLCRAGCHRRVLGNISIRARGVLRQTRVRLCRCLCALFDADDRSRSMKMRPMPRGRIFTLAPFALVTALAVGVALAGYLASPHAPSISARVDTSSPPATAIPTATAVAGTPELTASPTPAVSSKPVRSNDAAEMLRAHNDLRAAVGAPAMRSDVRVTAAAQRHAEYLARAGAIGHEETPGNPGFTGVTVRDRLAAEGYADATASEVAASSDSGTEDVRFLWDLPYHRLGLMHPHAVLAGWGHAEIGGHTATVGVLVFDFAAPAPDHVRSPAAGQRV